MPMVEIVVEDVKLQSVWIPVLCTLATLVKANEFKQSGENMRMCFFFRLDTRRPGANQKKLNRKKRQQHQE